MVQSNWIRLYSANKIIQRINGFEDIQVHFDKAEINLIGQSHLYGLTILNKYDTLLHCQQADIDYNSFESDSNHISFDRIALSSGFLNYQFLPQVDQNSATEMIFKSSEIEITRFSFRDSNHVSTIKKLKTDIDIDIGINNTFRSKSLFIDQAFIDLPQREKSDTIRIAFPFDIKIDKTTLYHVEIPKFKQLNIKNSFVENIIVKAGHIYASPSFVEGFYKKNKHFKLLNSYLELTESQFDAEIKLSEWKDLNLDLQLKATYPDLSALVSLDDRILLEGKVNNLLLPVEKIGMEKLSAEPYIACQCDIKGNLDHLELRDFIFENRNIKGDIKADLASKDSSINLFINELEYLYPEKIGFAQPHLRLNNSKVIVKGDKCTAQLHGGIDNLAFDCMNLKYHLKNKNFSTDLLYKFKDSIIEIKGETHIGYQQEKWNINNHIKSLTFGEQHYQLIHQDIHLSEGQFDIHLFSEELGNQLDFYFVYHLKENELQFDARIDDLVIYHLKDAKHIASNFSGDGKFISGNEHDMEFEFSDFLIWNDKDALQFDTLTFTSKADSIKQFNVSTEFINIELKGAFFWQDLPVFTNKVFSKIFPSTIHQKDSSVINSSFAEFKLDVTNANSPLNIIIPELSLSAGTHFESHIDLEKDSIWIATTTTGLVYQNIKFDTTVAFLNVSDTLMHFGFHSHHLTLFDTIGLENFKILTETLNDEVNSQILVHPDQYQRPFVLHFNTIIKPEEYYIELKNKSLYINDKKWEVEGPNRLLKYTHGKYFVNDFTISSDEQEIKIGSEQENQLYCRFDEVELGELLSIINFSDQLVSSKLNGYADLNIDEYSFKSNIDLDDLNIYGQAFNHAFVQLYKVGSGKPIFIEGKITHQREQALIKGIYQYGPSGISDINIYLDAIQANRLEQIIAPEVEDINGTLNGNISIAQRDNKTNVNGLFHSKLSSFYVPLLNMQYSFADTFELSNRSIFFNNTSLSDDKRKTADIQGSIDFSNNGINYNHLRIFPNDSFQLLATRAIHQPDFFGNLYARSEFNSESQRTYIEVNGNNNDPVINIKGALKKGSKLTIPIETAEEVTAGNFIRFIDTKNNNDTVILNESTSAYYLNCYTEINEEDTIEILLKGSSGEDVLSCFGNGNIRIETDDQGKFGMYGVYEVNKGNYTFHFRDFLKKKYNINTGSSISWNGDPYKAKLNLEATYRLRTNISDLLAFSRGTETIDDQQIRTAVKLYIFITGELASPQISFKIEIDDAEYANELRPLMAKIHNDPTELNKHVFTLLFINRFGPVFENPQSSRTRLIFTNMGEFFNTQLASILQQTGSEFLKSMDLDVGLDAHSLNNSDDLNDESAQKEFKLALSKSLFNDRVIVDIGGNYYFGADDIDNELAGDFGIEYIITKDRRLRAKVFNKSETDPLIRQNIYKRGVSLSYKREFDHISDLWKRYFKKATKEDEADLKIESDWTTKPNPSLSPSD